MRTIRCFLLQLLGALLAATIVSPIVRAQTPANVNGGFESASVGVVSDLANGVVGWDLESNTTVAPEFAIVDDVVHGGARALRVTVNSAGPNAFDVQAIAAQVTVVPGTTYRYSIWARTASGTSLASFTVGNQAFAEYGRLGDQTVTSTWQEYVFEFTVTDQETVIRAPVHVSFASNVGDIIFLDDLEIIEPTPPNLPDQTLAHGADKFLGNLHSFEQRPYFEYYWNQVTPENAGKWGSVEATRDVMNWADLDAAYALAKDNGLPFRFHVLVWGNQQPEWIASLPPNEQLAEIDEWFRAVAERYPDLDFVEVVNEPLHDPPSDQPGDPGSGNYIEALGGSGTTGWDWVITAFEMARDIFPEGTPLMINDYGILSSTSEANRYLEIINLLSDSGLIDKVGVQGHAFSTLPGAPLASVLDLLATTSLPIQITEMDVDGNPSSSGQLSDVASDENQLRDMQRIFPVLWEHPSVEGVTMWGWRIGHWRTAQDAFLVREDGLERPALEWIRSYISQNTTDIASGAYDEGVTLYQNFPNPSRASTDVRFELWRPADVRLEVFDVTGRRVRVLALGHQPAGEHTVPLSVADLSSGVYLYRVSAGGLIQSRRMIVAR